MARKLRLISGRALAGLIVLCAGGARAQVPVNYAGWYGYQGNHPFTEGRPWGLLLEATLKRDDVIRHDMAISGRVGLNYELPGGYRFTGGYAVQYSYPYDSASQPYNWVDHRVWEQFQWRYPFGGGRRHSVTQRYRVEQRWLERKSGADLETTGWDFENTFRYQLKLSLGLSRRISFALYDEVHLRVPPPRSERLLDQNRAYAGLAVALDEKRLWRVEAGFMNQSYWQSAETPAGRKRINHTFRVTLTSEAPFRSR